MAMTTTSQMSFNDRAMSDDSAVQPLSDSANVFCYLRRYFQDHPTEAALWCFGAGFLIGWKLKPW
jgi:hypothetical protein